MICNANIKQNKTSGSKITCNHDSLNGVDGRPFDVKVWYTDDFARKLGCHMPQMQKEDARLTLEAQQLAVALIKKFDEREEEGRADTGRVSTEWSLVWDVVG